MIVAATGRVELERATKTADGESADTSGSSSAAEGDASEIEETKADVMRAIDVERDFCCT
jgi:hypothetical protein